MRAGGPETASTAKFRITLLGTGNPRPTIERFGPSTLVEAGGRRLLFDCGRGATQRLFQLGVPLGGVDELWLTHLHSDHVVGIPDLWLTGWIFGRRTPFRVAGPEGTAAMVSGLREAHAFDVRMRRDEDERLPGEGARIEGRDVAPGLVFEDGGLAVRAFAVDHGPVRPAFGYRIDFQGRSAVLSGDTRPSEGLVRAAKGADVLIHEVAAAEGETGRDPDLIARVLAHHTSPREAGEVFAATRPRLAVYSHIVLLGDLTTKDLVERTRERYAGPLEVGEDLMAVTIGDDVRVERWAPP